MAGWAGSTRAARLPADWPARRVRVLERDGYRCRLRFRDVCIVLATDADHIHAGDDHREINLQAACGPCHARKTIAERPRPASIWRPAESHPGVL